MNWFVKTSILMVVAYANSNVYYYYFTIKISRLSIHYFRGSIFGF